MLSQTLEVNLAAGESLDICPMAAGMLICSARFIDADGCYNSIPDGDLCNACNAKGDLIYRLTASAAMTGYILICEEFDSGPDCVAWPAPNKSPVPKK